MNQYNKFIIVYDCNLSLAQANQHPITWVDGMLTLPIYFGVDITA